MTIWSKRACADAAWCASFWVPRHGDATAWLLSGALALVVVLNHGTAYRMNLWNRAIFDAPEKHNGSEVLFVTHIVASHGLPRRDVG
jgi:hypothetical protein